MKNYSKGLSFKTVKANIGVLKIIENAKGKMIKISLINFLML